MPSEYGARTLWMVVALLLLTTVIAVGYLLTSAAPQTAASQAVVPPVASRAISTPSARVWAPRGVRDAVGAFLAAWSSADPAERAAGLTATATESLAEQLGLTDPAEVPPACALAGALEVADLTPQSVLVTVPTTCEGSLWLGLARDATAAHGWRVTAIGRERSWIQ